MHTTKSPRAPKFHRQAALLTTAASTLIAAHANAALLNSSWVGDGSPDTSNGNGVWSNPAYWSPLAFGVPNNGGGDTYNVTVPGTTYGNGPILDLDVTIANLTISTVSQIRSQTGADLTVTGTTVLETGDSFGGVLVASDNIMTLGTLTNYNAATQTLEGGNLNSLGASIIQFRDANIVTNNGALVLLGAAQFLNQNNGANAITNLAVNNGVVQFADGANFTTAGNFSNSSLLAVTNFSGAVSTTFTVGGSLTNFNAGTGTLSNGELLASTPDAAATIRFAGADIRTIQNGAVSLFGVNARITDLLGNSAVRNLQRLENGRFTSAGFQTITPDGVIGGTFTSSNSTLTIESEATLRVRGNYYGTANSTTSLRAAGTTSGTCLSVEGSALFDQGARFDFGGQPGVNTIYTTKLQVINGLEFRGAFLTGTGTIFADTLLTQGSRLSPGHSAGQLDFDGALTLAVGTSLVFEIGGLTPGSEFDLVTQTGPLDLTLGGVLDLSFIDGFESLITGADTFEIITSENALLGEFDNIASGGRLDTSDGLGSFLVTYDGANSVVLSDFAPVPEPGAWALMGSALAVMLGRRRRSSRA